MTHRSFLSPVQGRVTYETEVSGIVSTSSDETYFLYRDSSRSTIIHISHLRKSWETQYPGKPRTHFEYFTEQSYYKNLHILFSKVSVSVQFQFKIKNFCRHIYFWQPEVNLYLNFETLPGIEWRKVYRYLFGSVWLFSYDLSLYLQIQLESQTTSLLAIRLSTGWQLVDIVTHRRLSIWN